MTSSAKLFGLLNRKERWSLSWKGWLSLLLLLLLAGWYVVLHLYPFLAVTHRVDAHVLVVEGWVPDEVVQAAIREFRTGPYDRILATGGPVEWSGPEASAYGTTAAWGAGRLLRSGLPPKSVVKVPSYKVGRDRTYSMALALRDWLQSHDPDVRAINVVTEDVHARRSRLLYQEALGPGVRVGIIAVSNPDYDTRHWWRYSEGVEDVIEQTIAYVYAKFLFYPETPAPAGQTTNSR